MLKTYYWLTKPGIIYGNSIAAVGGFLLASKGAINPLLFAAMLIGISLVIASACVVNNYIDRDIDKKMARTKKRALAKGKVSGLDALLFAGCLGLLGFQTLLAFTNLLTVGLALLGFLFYVAAYGYAKRKSVHGTVVGSIAGAVPPVVGYAAASGVFDTGALLIFLVLVFWQMPHFYAIATYRLKDYKAAGLPVLSVVAGTKAVKIQMLLYVIAFTAAVLLLTLFGYTGYTYAVIMSLLVLGWLGLTIKGFTVGDENRWARTMFRYSLLVLLAFCILISIEVVLP